MAYRIETETRCRAFRGYPLQTYRVCVTADAVTVWDSVAGYYTHCHDLSPRTQSRIRREARAQ